MGKNGEKTELYSFYRINLMLYGFSLIWFSSSLVISVLVALWGGVRRLSCLSLCNKGSPEGNKSGAWWITLFLLVLGIPPHGILEYVQVIIMCYNKRLLRLVDVSAKPAVPCGLAEKW